MTLSLLSCTDPLFRTKYVKSRLSFNIRGYPQLKVVKVANDTQESQVNKFTKVLVHHFAILRSRDRNTVRNASQIFIDDGRFEGEKVEISHICYKKLCVNPDHITFETSAINKSRNYCPVIVFINNILYMHCRHNRPCHITTEAKRRAFRYTNNSASSQQK